MHFTCSVFCDLVRFRFSIVHISTLSLFGKNKKAKGSYLLNNIGFVSTFFSVVFLFCFNVNFRSLWPHAVAETGTKGGSDVRRGSRESIFAGWRVSDAQILLIQFNLPIATYLADFEFQFVFPYRLFIRNSNLITTITFVRFSLSSTFYVLWGRKYRST